MISALSVPDGPTVLLIDAQAGRLDPAALRERARALTPRAAHVSRSYSYPYALVSWHGASVGVDIERLEGGGTPFAASISTPRERMTAGIAGAGCQAEALWSSKEALAKALGDPVRYDPRRLESPLHWPNGRAGRWRVARLEPRPGYVAFVCWEHAPGQTPTTSSRASVENVHQ